MSYRVWGWGSAADEPTEQGLRELAPYVAEVTGLDVQEPERPGALQELPPVRRTLPGSLARLGSTDPEDRARHGIGRAYRDVITAVRGQVRDVPDVVVGFRPPYRHQRVAGCFV